MVEFTQVLQHRLQKQLPGAISHQKMAPVPLQSDTYRVKPGKNYRKSAVLSLLIPDEEHQSPELLFTLRAPHLDYHAHQISFPGGRIEPEETAIEAALRETNEEVGIKESDVQILGELSTLYVHPSQNMIYPVVGYLPYRPNFMLQEEEVAEAFTIPLSALLDPKNVKKEVWNIRDVPLHVPFWQLHSVPLWGATAMICSELISIISEFHT